MATAGRDLLADDHLEAEPAFPRDGPRCERSVDPLVVRDRDDVELGGRLDPLQDLQDPGRPVGGERVDVEVRATRPDGRIRVIRTIRMLHGMAAHAAASPSRSGQIGKKTAHHCSGASATSRSKASAWASMNAVTRSRRVPSAGGTIRSSRPTYRPRAIRRTLLIQAGAPVSTASNAGPRGNEAGAPKNVTGIPPPVRSRSATRPTGPPCPRAVVSSRRASRSPTRRIPIEPRVRTK